MEVADCFWMQCIQGGFPGVRRVSAREWTGATAGEEYQRRDKSGVER